MKKIDLGKKIYNGERITQEEALELYSWDLLDLGWAADKRRELIVPGKNVGFIIDRIINYTNKCEAACSFCAFHSRADRIPAYELSIDEIFQKIDELISAGGTQVMLQGGLHPDYTIDWYLNLVKAVKEKFPQIYLHSFSPAELIHISRKSSLDLDKVIKILKDAGLSSVPGASDLLVDEIRNRVSPRKISVEEWCSVIYSLAENGMKSSATMTYGMGESQEDQIQHLFTVRKIQDETSILRAFIPWSFSPENTLIKDILPSTGVDYLKILSISRIFLDNIVNFQAGWLTEGLKPAQIALAFGANDMGGVLMEESVVKATGINTDTNKDQLISLIKDAGKVPVQRDSDYKEIKKY